MKNFSTREKLIAYIVYNCEHKPKEWSLKRMKDHCRRMAHYLTPEATEEDFNHIFEQIEETLAESLTILDSMIAKKQKELLTSN